MTQTQSKHTPGPWRFCRIPLFNPQHPDATYAAFTANHAGGEDWMRTAQANARLIAAAPDLLEALRLAVACGAIPQLSSLPQTDTEIGRCARAVHAAITKATPG